MSFLTKLCNFFTKTSSSCRSSASAPNIVHETQFVDSDHKLTAEDCNGTDSIASKDSIGWLSKSPPNHKKVLHQTDPDQLSIIVKILSDERENILKIIDENECNSGNINDALKKHDNVLNNVITKLCWILVSYFSY